MTEEPPQTAPLLLALRERLGAEALHIVLPLSAAAFDAVVTPFGGRRAGDLVEGAAGVVLIGDGGPGFFAHFRDAAPYASGADHPLDDFTRACIGAAVREVLGPLDVASRVLFPFSAGSGDAPLPFQRLGRAAGLPDPGPLGLQLHPEFGPWWAYRALVVMAAALEAEPPMLPWCPPCDQPCVRGCAIHEQGGDDGTTAGPCGDDCGGRSRCPVGRQHAYPPDQIGFHLRARDALRAARASAP